MLVDWERVVFVDDLLEDRVLVLEEVLEEVRELDLLVDWERVVLVDVLLEVFELVRLLVRELLLLVD